MYGCLPYLLLSVFLLLFSALAGLLRIVFGVRRSARRFADAVGGKTAGPASEKRNAAKKKRKEKHFQPGEGDYVDFEEIKD